MILQNVIWDGMSGDMKELYVRGENLQFESGNLKIKEKSFLSTDTYMNLFDMESWKKYTSVKEIMLHLWVCGKGKIIVREINRMEKKKVVIFQEQEKREIKILIPKSLEGKLYFEIQADTDVNLYKAGYKTIQPVNNTVRIAIVICTFQRKTQLKRLLGELKKIKVKLPNTIEVFVVDNDSNLKYTEFAGVRLYHNPNTGGAGGFGKGMEEVVKEYEKFPATHVLLMDDDITIQTESIERLYALLSYMQAEYMDEIIAGRMFCMDKPWVQYTAAEKWNGGDLQHIGFRLDMKEKENLLNINDNSGAEYSGWWFCCISYDYVKENCPLPFFLHCDDAEYGLRHGGVPIILNGIQVWHETYEYRYNPIVAYYDMRNSLFVNEIYQQQKTKEELLIWWKEKITKAHVKKDYQMEGMLILGMWDFLKGIEWLEKIDAERNHRNRICAMKIKNKLITAMLWRITEIKYRHKR